MIKVIASDLDGTLLNDRHEVSEVTRQAIARAEEAGILFVPATGRSYESAMAAIGKCDFSKAGLYASGAEVRDNAGRVISRVMMDYDMIERIYEYTLQYPVGVSFCSSQSDFAVGTQEEIRQLLIDMIRSFYMGRPEKIDDHMEEVLQSEWFIRSMAKTVSISSVSCLREQQIPVYKAFIFSQDIPMLQKLNEKLVQIPGVVSASSFPTNLELTHERAQKGPVLKDYVISRGYTMDEVMVFGDSMNDYSMLSMDFGATIAVENAMEEVKEAAKYMTKSNEEDGVAYAIHEMLDRRKSL